MKFVNKHDKRIRFLLPVIDSFSKHVWVIRFREKGITKGTTKAFQNLYIGLPMKKQNMGRNKL